MNEKHVFKPSLNLQSHWLYMQNIFVCHSGMLNWHISLRIWYGGTLRQGDLRQVCPYFRGCNLAKEHHRQWQIIKFYPEFCLENKVFSVVVIRIHSQFTFTIFHRFLSTNLPKYLEFYTMNVYNFSRFLTTRPPSMINVNYERHLNEWGF